MDIKRLVFLLVLIVGAIIVLTALAGCDDDGSSDSTSPAVTTELNLPEIEPGAEPGDPESPPAVPLPGAIILGGIGVGCVGWLKRKKKI